MTEHMHIVSVLVEHKPRVMQRITALVARRGFNIESITVGVTEKPEVARITLLIRGDDRVLEQVTKQLNKLIDVIKVLDLKKDGAIQRELGLIKVHSPSHAKREEIVKCANLFGAKIADVSPQTVTIEISDTTEKVNSLVGMLKPHGIREIVRTGVAAISKGASENGNAG